MKGIKAREKNNYILSQGTLLGIRITSVYSVKSGQGSVYSPYHHITPLFGQAYTMKHMYKRHQFSHLLHLPLEENTFN